MGKVTRQTKINILKILRVLKEAHTNGEGYLTVNRIAKRTGLHKWSVSRILDLYMPYVTTKMIEELDTLGLQAKLVELAKPEITDEQALRFLSVRI